MAKGGPQSCAPTTSTSISRPALSPSTPVARPRPSSLLYRAPEYVQFRARFDGTVQWICPSCDEMNAGNRAKVSFRSPTTLCRRCHRRFQLGLAFWSPDRVISRLSAVYCDVPVHLTSHTKNAQTDGEWMIARPLGTLWWACGCRQSKRSVLSRKNDTIYCTVCGHTYKVSLIFYRIPKGKHSTVKTPLDWTLPVWDLHD